MPLGSGVVLLVPMSPKTTPMHASAAGAQARGVCTWATALIFAVALTEWVRVYSWDHIAGAGHRKRMRCGRPRIMLRHENDVLRSSPHVNGQDSDMKTIFGLRLDRGGEHQMGCFLGFGTWA